MATSDDISDLAYPVEEIRRDFPILARRIGEPELAYLDSANTSQKPRVVVEAMAAHYLEHNANVARAMHTLGAEATAAYEGARGTIARFIGAARPEEVVFTKNASEALNLLAYTLGSSLKVGDEVVVSVAEHHSNIVPWQLACQRSGATLRWFDITPEGRLDLDAARQEDLINSRTKVVALTWVSNVTGAVSPLAEIGQWAKEVGADFVVDGSQAVPHRPVRPPHRHSVRSEAESQNPDSAGNNGRSARSDAEPLIHRPASSAGTASPRHSARNEAESQNPDSAGNNSWSGTYTDYLPETVDFLAFTGHKMLGPTGIGVLWGRYDRLAELPPFLGGGEMIEVVKMTGSTYARPPHRFEAGTPPIAQAVGLAAACDYLTNIGPAAIAAHERAITAYTLERLAAIPEVWLLGPATTEQRGSAVSFTLADIHPHDVMTVLDSYGIAVRGGHHCARPLHERFGVVASVRVSPYLYTTYDEIDRLGEALEACLSFFGVRSEVAE